MQLDEKLLQLLTDSVEKIADSIKIVAEKADVYNKRIFIMFLSLLISGTIIICMFINCYFKASYNKEYSESNTPDVTIEQSVGNSSEYDIDSIEIGD